MESLRCPKCGTDYSLDASDPYCRLLCPGCGLLLAELYDPGKCHCGAQLEMKPSGQGGGLIVCPTCGVRGGYDCRPSEDFWKQFDK